MNILYCGDKNIEEGLLISVLSLINNVREEICVYVMTMQIEYNGRAYAAVSDSTISFLDERVRAKFPLGFVKKLDVTEKFRAEVPEANMSTRFTPFCMLRLFADQFSELPDKLLYLDNDVVCRRDITDFYSQPMDDWELAGVLDYYGGWFFRRNIFRRDYINSGVLLLNLARIRESGLFSACRRMCVNKKMFMPDQSAINKLSSAKKLLPRKYNEQRKLKSDTVLQHFTTSFRFFPWLHTLTVKPWQVDKVHDVLKLHEYDELLTQFQTLLPEMRAAD